MNFTELTLIIFFDTDFTNYHGLNISQSFAFLLVFVTNFIIISLLALSLARIVAETPQD